MGNCSLDKLQMTNDSFHARSAVQQMSVKVIIFDFDGTVADTLDAVVNISNRLAREFGYRRIEPEEVNKLRNLSSREIVRQSGISIFKLPILLKKVISALRKDIQYLKPIAGIKEALVQLKSEGNELVILTSNSEENVRIFLKENDLQDLFSYIYSENKLFSKHNKIINFIRKNKLIPEEVIYVGDETRDIESSKKVPIKVVAVSWGFNSKEALAKHHPDFLIDQPRDLIEVMHSF
jgi:phosphoglycolate phosphatase-like HAD superfamily hydrolase